MVLFKLPCIATVIVLYPRGIFATPQCYWPNGQIVSSDNNYVPCNSTATASACCSFYDACTTDGWCLGSAGMVYRGGCTDSTWKSGVCQSTYCFNTNTANYQNLLSCSNGNLDTSGGLSTWCCGGAGSSTCCNSAFQLGLPSDPTDGLTGKAFIPDIREPKLTITITITSTLLPSNGVSATAIITTVAGKATASLGSNAGLSKGAVAGVSVAAAVGGAVTGLAIAFLLLRKQRQPPPHISDQQAVDFPSKPPDEMDGRQARYEVQ